MIDWSVEGGTLADCSADWSCSLLRNAIPGESSTCALDEILAPDGRPDLPPLIMNADITRARNVIAD